MPNQRHRRLAQLWLFAAACMMAGSAPAAAAGSYPFTLNVTFSPKATARYAVLRTQMKVRVFYGGEPIPSKANLDDVDETGSLGLTVEELVVPARSGIVRITGKSVPSNRVSWVKRLKVSMNILNTWKYTLQNQKDGLSCGPVDEIDYAAVQRNGMNVTCRLQSEATR